MSTVDTQANTGASFMVNDLYKRFIRRDATDAHYVRASQVCTVIMLGIAVTVAYFMGSVRAAWEYLATLTAGYGFIVVARWFWWRINAWAELAALAGCGLGSLVANHLLRPYLHTFGQRFIVVAAISTASWILVSLVTRPCPLEDLVRFCRAVRPFPLGWGPVRRAHPELVWSPSFGRSMALWGVGMVFVFSLCFGVGHLLLGSASLALLFGTLVAASLLAIIKYWRP
jgi:hypothetical protein